MAALFDCSTDNIGVHLKNIFESGELQQEATAEKISVVEKYRIIQDRIFESDFDKFELPQLPFDTEEKEENKFLTSPKFLYLKKLFYLCKRK